MSTIRHVMNCLSMTNHVGMTLCSLFSAVARGRNFRVVQRSNAQFAHACKNPTIRRKQAHLCPSPVRAHSVAGGVLSLFLLSFIVCVFKCFRLRRGRQGRIHSKQWRRVPFLSEFRDACEFLLILVPSLLITDHERAVLISFRSMLYNRLTIFAVSSLTHNPSHVNFLTLRSGTAIFHICEDVAHWNCVFTTATLLNIQFDQLYRQLQPQRDAF